MAVVIAVHQLNGQINEQDPFPHLLSPVQSNWDYDEATGRYGPASYLKQAEKSKSAVE